jgi:hypothetical protein
MSDLHTRIEAEHPHLSAEQLHEVKRIDDYLAANRVHEILNVSLEVVRRRWRDWWRRGRRR